MIDGFVNGFFQGYGTLVSTAASWPNAQRLELLLKLLRPLVAHDMYPAVCALCEPVEDSCKRICHEQFRQAARECTELWGAANDLVPLLGQGYPDRSASIARLGRLITVAFAAALITLVRNNP